MKHYVEPIVNLLYLENEDVLTMSEDDPYGSDPGFGAEEDETVE